MAENLIDEFDNMLKEFDLEKMLEDRIISWKGERKDVLDGLDLSKETLEKYQHIADFYHHFLEVLRDDCELFFRYQIPISFMAEFYLQIVNDNEVNDQNDINERIDFDSQMSQLGIFYSAHDINLLCDVIQCDVDDEEEKLEIVAFDFSVEAYLYWYMFKYEFLKYLAQNEDQLFPNCLENAFQGYLKLRQIKELIGAEDFDSIQILNQIE